jgi:hypothetical protein
MKASATVKIWGTTNCWKVATTTDPAEYVQERFIELEIQGDETNGFHLNVSPAGCFTADSWHPTIGDAMETAERLFGVERAAWNK